MPINRFDKPAEQPVLNTYTRLPFAQLAQMGMVQQRREDETTQRLGALDQPFKHRTIDADLVKSMRGEIDQWTEEYLGKHKDITSLEAQRDFLEYKRKLSMDPRRQTIEQNLAKQQALQKEIDEAEKAGNVPYNLYQAKSELERAAQTPSYARTTDGYDFDSSPYTVGSAEITKFDDVGKRVEELVDDVHSSSVEKYDFLTKDGDKYIVDKKNEGVYRAQLDNLILNREEEFIKGTLAGRNLINRVSAERDMRDRLGLNQPSDFATELHNEYLQLAKGAAYEKLWSSTGEKLKADPFAEAAAKNKTPGTVAFVGMGSTNENIDYSILNENIIELKGSVAQDQAIIDSFKESTGITNRYLTADDFSDENEYLQYEDAIVRQRNSNRKIRAIQNVFNEVEKQNPIDWEDDVTTHSLNNEYFYGGNSTPALKHAIRNGLSYEEYYASETPENQAKLTKRHESLKKELDHGYKGTALPGAGAIKAQTAETAYATVLDNYRDTMKDLVEQKGFNQQKTAIAGDSKSDIGKFSDLLQETFLKGNVQFDTNDGRTLLDEDIQDLIEGKNGFIQPVLESINDRPGFAITYTDPDTKKKETIFGNLGGTGNVADMNEAGANLKSMALSEYTEHPTKQKELLDAGHYLTGYSLPAKIEGYPSVGEQFEDLKVYSWPKGASEVVNTPFGDINIEKVEGDRLKASLTRNNKKIALESVLEILGAPRGNKLSYYRNEESLIQEISRINDAWTAIKQ